MFAEAMRDGTAKSFFRLMEMLHTQNEPEHCGLATLVTVLNALGVDPYRRWKGIWRFFSEELLDCCEPLSNFKNGINFDRLASLARCNGLSVRAVSASDTSLDAFRERVRVLSQTQASSMVLAYSRKTLNQTGSGHYSPMGAYHAPSDHLLILDVARFKYRPHWVPLPLMFDAMRLIDPATNKTRGFIELSQSPAPNPPPAAARIFTVTPMHERLGEGLVADVARAIRESPVAVAATAASSTAAPAHTTQQEGADVGAVLNAAASVLRSGFHVHSTRPAGVCASTTRRERVNAQLAKSEAFRRMAETASSPQDVRERALVVLCMDAEFWNRVFHAVPLSGAACEAVARCTDVTNLGDDLRSEVLFARTDLGRSLRLS